MTTYHLIHAGASFIVSLGSFIAFTVFNNSFGAYHGAMAATADAFTLAVIYYYRCEIVEDDERRSTTENCIKSLSIYGFLILLLNFVQFIFRLIMQLRNEPAATPAQVAEAREKILIEMYGGERSSQTIITCATSSSQRLQPRPTSSHARCCEATFISHIAPGAAVAGL